ncbi:hypothetical protein C8F01DRAFT_1118523 [Mycena amicta]|nr:hypothetical protein C8F01DRAFT_1118523 [Mycena amicta]
MQPPSSHRVHITITRLPTKLSIVSIPRSRLDTLTHPVLRLLLQPNSVFFSITANLIELSLFADSDSVGAFDAIARADQASPQTVEPVQVSNDRWCVLQIDSHSDQLDDAGARVSELSAPLAAAGISILYQSSYMSDFIFVKERRLAEVMSLFAASGFDLYADPNLLTASLAPPPLPAPATATRERSGSAPAPSSSRSSSRPHSKVNSRTNSTGTSTATQKPKSGLDVPLPDVRVLAPDLACVGLADDAVEQWQLKIVKLLAFPDLIPLPSRAPSLSHPSGRATSLVPKEDEGDDGYFSHSPSPTPEDDKPDGGSNSVPRSPSREVPSRLDALPASISWSESEIQLVEEPSIEHAIPFFSFARTPEGSSLTAGARVLAALFPHAERHMVICGGELDAADREMEEMAQCSPTATSFSSVPSSPVVDKTEYDSSDDEDEDDGHPLLTALQIDLRSAGLDTHGLVHRFSRALARGGVNHMYSSTLRSANILVPTGRNGRSARRASSLLREC